ncbi:hypothetical protein CCHR01_11561 [Colletotrichum chrysophilum]|uniref:Uncharacterized protein n=1 Tax=Colletotrichum chrysophilum TaxID=1836956 RepID=A0AAD9ADM0_9PEZI|nr:hypothetical protein CCHR01_11561 [Colletotrichum chrysophilum]
MSLKSLLFLSFTLALLLLSKSQRLAPIPKDLPHSLPAQTYQHRTARSDLTMRARTFRSARITSPPT